MLKKSIIFNIIYYITIITNIDIRLRKILKITILFARIDKSVSFLKTTHVYIRITIFIKIKN